MKLLIHIYIYIGICIRPTYEPFRGRICDPLCMYVCMCVCIHMHIHLYMYIYTNHIWTCSGDSIWCIASSDASLLNGESSWDMTHVCMGHVCMGRVWCMYATCVGRVCNKSHSLMQHISFMNALSPALPFWWMVRVREAWPICVWDMTQAYVLHDKFMWVIWLIHTCDMTCACVWHTWFAFSPRWVELRGTEHARVHSMYTACLCSCACTHACVH